MSNPAIALLLYLACVVAALLSIPAAIWGVVSLARQRTKKGIVLFVASAVLLSPFAAILITGQLDRHRELTIEAARLLEMRIV